MKNPNLVREVSTIAQLPSVVGSHYGKKAALIIEDREITFQEIEVRSNMIANALVRDGVAEGDRIAYIGKDSSDTVLLLFGSARCKSVFVNINWRLAPEEVVYILQDAAPRILFLDVEFLRLLPKIDGVASVQKIVVISGNNVPGHENLWNWCGGESNSRPELSYSPDDVVVQIYTSGTTGHPKGVRLPNRSFFSLAQEMDAAGDKWASWTDETVSLICVPMFHVAGIWQLIRGMALGSTSVMMKNFNPGAILKLIPRYRVTLTGMVPSMIHVVLAEPECVGTDFSSLRTIVYGGAPVSPALLKKAMAVFGCDFLQIYGLTETGNMAVCLRSEDHRSGDDRKLLAAGRPLPGVEVRIIDERGHAVGPGSPGQIAIKSPARMAGYWNIPEETGKTLVDGWIMTGDIGRMDEEGLIYVCDRSKDMIISAGENIYPAEIENVIRCHEAVADVAVIGVPHDLWGEAVKAVIVPQPERQVRSTEIIRHARAYLAEFKVPRSVDVVDALPRNASGKVLKGKLREPYWQGHARRVN